MLGFQMKMTSPQDLDFSPTNWAERTSNGGIKISLIIE